MGIELRIASASLCLATACASPLVPAEEWFRDGGPQVQVLGADGGADGSPALDPEEEGEGLTDAAPPPTSRALAEDFVDSFAPGGQFGYGAQWSTESEPSGGEANLYLRADPSTEECQTGAGCSILEHAPRVSYDLVAEMGGQHFLWVRGRADSDARDSLHLGVDGALVQPDWDFADESGQWRWKRSSALTLTEGVHRVDVFMREGGFEMDEVWLTPDATFNPED